MADLDAACAHLLASNAPDKLPDTLRVLSMLLMNLAREDCAKFRRVNCGNAKVAATISLPGAKEVLIAAGFEPVEEGGALETKAENASARAAAAAAALDNACAVGGAPYALRGGYWRFPLCGCCGTWTRGWLK